jgi:hypothetical protein
MPSPVGWREVPCIECGDFVAGINFAERCAACQARRMRRADRLASRAAIGAAILAAAWSLWALPHTPMLRWWAGLAIGSSFLLVRLIVKRVAMEVLR